MNANELRIGNLIYELRDTPESPNYKDIFQIAAINSLTNTLIDKDDNITSLDYCEPIPLTYTIMERAGFITMDYEIDVIVWAREDTENIFMLSQNGIPVNDQPIVFEYEVDSEIQKEVKWVHELQNLYFILCGVELEIKL